MPSRSPVAQGAGDSQRSGILECAQLSWRDRRLVSRGGRHGSEVLSAEGGTRTPTGLRPLAPEASASTSSTTSASFLRNGNLERCITPSQCVSCRRQRGKNFHRQEPKSPARLPSPGDVGGGTRAYRDRGKVAA